MLPSRVAFSMSRHQSEAPAAPPRITADTRLNSARTADVSVVVSWDGACYPRDLNEKAWKAERCVTSYPDVAKLWTNSAGINREITDYTFIDCCLHQVGRFSTTPLRALLHKSSQGHRTSMKLISSCAPMQIKQKMRRYNLRSYADHDDQHRWAPLYFEGAPLPLRTERSADSPTAHFNFLICSKKSILVPFVIQAENYCIHLSPWNVHYIFEQNLLNKKIDFAKWNVPRKFFNSNRVFCGVLIELLFKI